MNYKGVIIEESLEDLGVLGDVKTLDTVVEKVTKRHKTPWVEQWTLRKVEIEEDRGDKIANKISNSLEIEHPWYADFKNEKFHYIIFSNKVFKIDRASLKEYKAAVDYGLSLGIPDYQLDFSPDIEERKRNI